MVTNSLGQQTLWRQKIDDEAVDDADDDEFLTTTKSSHKKCRVGQ